LAEGWTWKKTKLVVNGECKVWNDQINVFYSST